MENDIENNKIIAEFMGAKLTKNLKIMYPVYEGDSSYVKNLKYHSDWNWLMPVVEKIEGIGKTELKFSVHFENVKLSSDIQVVYNACVEFIKWYNENKSK